MAVIDIKPKDVVIPLNISILLKKLTPKENPESKPQEKEKQNDSINR